MTAVHGKNTVVFLDAYDVTTWLNSASYTQAMDTAETTAFGSSARSYIPSFPGGTVSLGGMFDGTALAIDDILSTIVDSQASNGPPVPLSLFPQGATAGNRGLISTVYDSSYSVTSPVNDVVAVAADFTYAAKMGSGKILLANQTTASAAQNPVGNTTGWVDFTTSGTSAGVANLHVTANTFSNTTAVKLQHATDASGTGVADLTGGAFSSIAASTKKGQTIQVPSQSMNQFIRAITTPTGTGSITLTVTFAKA